jgi:hypothetical protein
MRQDAAARPDAGAAGRAIGERGIRDRGVPDAGQRATPVPPPVKNVDTLLVYSKGFDKGKVDLYNEAYFASAAKHKEIDSWREIVETIREYRSINRLVFLVHSRPGEFLFGPDAAGRIFRERKSLAEAARDLAPLQGKPAVRSVDLAGCNVGLDIDGVVQFGLALNASDVTATNHFHEFALARVGALPGKGAEIERALLGLRGYVTTPRTDELVTQAKTETVSRLVLLEWYVAFAEEHVLNLPAGPGVDSNARAKTFKRPGDALNVGVGSQADLDMLRQDFARFGGAEPIRRLIRIAVNLDGFRAAPDAGRATPAAVRPPPSPGTGSGDAGRRTPPRGDWSRRPASSLPPRGRSKVALDAGDQAIVDEVFRRGGSVGDAMGVLYMRALNRASPGAGLPSPGRRETGRRFTLEDRGLLDREPWEPSKPEEPLVEKIEALRPLVSARLNLYLGLVRREFEGLPQHVAPSFKPLTKPPHVDPFKTDEEKYRAMRSAYYRAGWTCIKRDILDLIVPTKFFGAPVIGGTHRELNAVLAAVEQDVRKTSPGLAGQPNAAGFVIGGFVPRFQAGSEELSNHAFGLAIDIDPTWNPQLKSPAARKAFARATGDDIGRALYAASSMDAVRQIYARVKLMSDRLKKWLDEWLPKYEQLQKDRTAARKDPNGKQRVFAIDTELKANLDLAALVALIDEYTLPTVQSWQIYGIGTIPPEIIEAFETLGRKNGARWGGRYEESKDVMHLELLYLAGKQSPDAPGRRKPVTGFEDLVRGDAPMAPDCRVSRPPPAAPPERLRVPVRPLG